MKVHIVPNYVIVDGQGRMVYDEADARSGKEQFFMDEEMKKFALENFKTF